MRLPWRGPQLDGMRMADDPFDAESEPLQGLPSVAARDDVDEAEWLRRMRHSAAHVLAQVVLEMFPEGKIAIGPPIDTGFYYDFDLPRPLTPEDLSEIQKRMRKEIGRNHRFIWEEITVAEARTRFADQPFKQELIDQFSLDSDRLGICTHAGFTDLCRGGHVESTRQIGPLRLTNVAGAYWRGDEQRPQLQRVYGALFATREELDAHFARIEEAQRRDHRRLGRELELFAFDELVGAGVPLLLPDGAIVRQEMERLIRELQDARGYQEVWTGHLARGELFRRSGHLENYSDVMYPAMHEHNEDGEDGDAYFLKPMNCPVHMTLYNNTLHSYRELPLRYAEYTTLYRFEKSGQLSGLTRVRSLTQDDCHIFITPDQITDEVSRVLELVQTLFETYGMPNFRYELSLPGEGGKFVDDADAWSFAVRALRDALDAAGIDYVEQQGEAAFYGPKADLFVSDVMGREWQLSTIQLDLIQPARLGCVYVADDGERRTPVVIHRAIHGSFERFMGILIEHYAGAFPLWLAPKQARCIPIADRHQDWANDVAAELRAAGLRVDVDDGNERMQAKIRNGQRRKIPYLLVIGDREVESKSAAVRVRTGEDLGAMPLDQIRDMLTRLKVSRASEPV
ncbi:MAG: threonine--tRNA ligase [Chloroflexi bacterium]|nr:threonine--tRNA ligase [Chloroflexota bacterium]MCY3697717.1 threonine--tRNA ligase [Chloroflexota bacterium]